MQLKVKNATDNRIYMLFISYKVIYKLEKKSS